MMLNISIYLIFIPAYYSISMYLIFRSFDKKKIDIFSKLDDKLSQRIITTHFLIILYAHFVDVSIAENTGAIMGIILFNFVYTLRHIKLDKGF